jgi:hypothetical protein
MYELHTSHCPSPKPGVFLLIVCKPFAADLVLKDKIFVYDLANMRMGWADYDCKFRSLPFVRFIVTLPANSAFPFPIVRFVVGQRHLLVGEESVREHRAV